MFGSKRDDGTADDLVRERFVRVVGLPAYGETGETREASETGEAPEARETAGAAAALAAFDPGRRGVRVLAAVALAVVCIAAFLVWHARPRPAPAPPVVAVGSAVVSSGATVLVVSVGGRVHKPGLVRLPAGARVADAIEAAGGALPGTDLSYVNLARKIIDGELIMVGVTPPPGAAPGPSGAGVGAGKVNVNTATLIELQTLPGIGAVLAQRIIEYRDKQGGFRSVNDLRQVEGIGDAKFQQLKDRVTV